MSTSRAGSADGSSGIPPALERLLGTLDREGIRWSLLRPRATLAQTDGDVDLLITPAGLGATRHLLCARGFLTMSAPGPDLHAATYDEEAGRFVWVHVQPALRLAGDVLPAEALLREASDEFPSQPGDAWLLWILLLRALVDKGDLPERHRPHVMALAQAWQGGPAELESLARRHGLEPAEVVAEAAAGDWGALLRRSVHRPATERPWPARIVGALAGIRGPRAGRGLGVAVLGPDGAGKTTLVEGLRRSLPLPTRVLYMGLTGGRLPKADALRVPGLVFAARLVILWVRYAYAAYHRAQGRIVLFDRYTLDGAVPSGAQLSPAGRISRRLQRRVCPMPDLVLLLDAPGTTLHARSGEYDPAVLETWRSAYSALEGSVRALEVIDAELPVEQVRREAEARIWRRYGELRRPPKARR